MKSRQTICRLFALTFALLLWLTGCTATQTDDETKKQEAALNMQVGTVKTDAFTMDYFRFGEGTKTLVILPGLSVQSVMGSADAVAEAYRPLTKDFTIYLFDRRKDLPPVYSVQEMAQDTAAAIDALGLDRVSIFGASQGGMMALHIAIAHPALVEKLILVSTAASVTDTLAQSVEKWVKLAQEGDTAG